MSVTTFVSPSMPEDIERSVKSVTVPDRLPSEPGASGTGPRRTGKVWGMPALFVLVGGLLGGAGFLFYFLTVRGNYEASAVLKYETSVAGYRRLASVAFSPEGFSAWAAAERGAFTCKPKCEDRRRPPYFERSENAAPIRRSSGRPLMLA